MAIQLAYSDPDTGATYAAAYWRANITFPASLQFAVVNVDVYADVAAAAGKIPVASRRFVIGPAAFPIVFPAPALVSEITARAYAFLKARAEFNGATDV